MRRICPRCCQVGQKGARKVGGGMVQRSWGPRPPTRAKPSSQLESWQVGKLANRQNGKGSWQVGLGYKASLRDDGKRALSALDVDTGTGGARGGGFGRGAGKRWVDYGKRASSVLGVALHKRACEAFLLWGFLSGGWAHNWFQAGVTDDTDAGH